MKTRKFFDGIRKFFDCTSWGDKGLHLLSHRNIRYRCHYGGVAAFGKRIPPVLRTSQ